MRLNFAASRFGLISRRDYGAASASSRTLRGLTAEFGYFNDGNSTKSSSSGTWKAIRVLQT